MIEFGKFSGFSDSSCKPACFSLAVFIHVGRDDQHTAVFADPVHFTQRCQRVVQQMDHVSGYDLIETAVCKWKCSDVSLSISYVAENTAILFSFLKHLLREVRCCKLSAFRCNNGAQKPCSAGTFEHNIARLDQIPYDFLQLLVRLPVNDIDEDIIYTGHFIPKHPVTSS